MAQNGLSVRMTRRDLLLLILAFVITRAAITAAGVVALRVLLSNEGSEFTHLLDGGAALDMWYRWDAGFYATIATEGYHWLNERQPNSDMAFLPLYPLLTHLVSGITPTGCLASPYQSTCATVGGLVVSNAALLLAAMLLFDLALAHFGKHAAWSAVLLLLISPISIFLSGVYTEALFLLLTMLTFWLLERDRFVLAVIAASLACLTRSVGVALFLPLLWAAWRPLSPTPSPTQAERGEKDKDERRTAVRPYNIRENGNTQQGRGVPRLDTGDNVGEKQGRTTVRPYRVILAFVPPLMFAGYILLAGLTVGDPLAYFKMYASVWNRTAGTPIQAFTVYFSGQKVAWFGWDVSWIDLIMTLFYLALAIILLAREKTRTWGLFALVAVLIPIASGTLIGMPRFGAVLFPFTILLAAWANRWYKQVIVYGAAAALALLFIARFVTWRWIA